MSAFKIKKLQKLFKNKNYCIFNYQKSTFIYDIAVAVLILVPEHVILNISLVFGAHHAIYVSIYLFEML